MRSYQKLATIIALALTLALPVSALAATSTGTVAESIDNAATVSMTVPASMAYTLQSGTTWQSVGGLAVTNLSTNNPTGLNVKATYSNFAGTPSGTINVTNRSLIFVSGGGGLSSSNCNGFSSGTITTTSQLQLMVGGVNAPLTNGSCTFTPKVDNVGVSSYSGSISVTATTNP